LQESYNVQTTALATIAEQLGDVLQSLNTRVTNVQVSFMNTADVTVVITAIANFQIKVVLDL
jgi:hypothetical protein